MKKIIALLLIVVMIVNGVNDCFAIGPDDVENPDSYGTTTEITDGIAPDDHKETFWDKAKRNIKCVGGLAIFAGLIIGGGYIVGSLKADGYNRDDDLELPQEQNNINTLEDYKPTIISVDKIEHPELFMDKIPEQNSVEPVVEPEDDIADSIEEKKENTQQRRQLDIKTGTCGTSLTWTLDTDNGKLTISGSGSMYIYASDSKAPWYSYRNSITSVTIENGVTSIGQRAFDGCISLTSITIPSSVTSIGQSAFEGCSGLTSVTIPSSVTSIGSHAFYGCSGLTSITIPGSVKEIGFCVFSYCSGLTSITIPSSVTSIGYMAFDGCSGLTSITIPSSVTSIGYYAFDGCISLTSITIPSSVTSIGWSAFKGCSGLTSVTIENGVTSIGYMAFGGCSGLTSITIPSSVTSIDDSAFKGCSGLTSVTIPASVTSIGYKAFEGCSGLTSVTIPGSVTSIGYDAFYGCSALTSVTYRGVTEPTHGTNVFGDCNALEVVKVPSAYTSDTFCGITVIKPARSPLPTPKQTPTPKTKSRDDMFQKNSRYRVLLGF